MKNWMKTVMWISGIAFMPDLIPTVKAMENTPVIEKDTLIEQVRMIFSAQKLIQSKESLNEANIQNIEIYINNKSLEFLLMKSPDELKKEIIQKLGDPVLDTKRGQREFPLFVVQKEMQDLWNHIQIKIPPFSTCNASTWKEISSELINKRTPLEKKLIQYEEEIQKYRKQKPHVPFPQSMLDPGSNQKNALDWKSETLDLFEAFFKQSFAQLYGKAMRENNLLMKGDLEKMSEDWRGYEGFKETLKTLKKNDEYNIQSIAGVLMQRENWDQAIQNLIALPPQKLEKGIRELKEIFQHTSPNPFLIALVVFTINERTLQKIFKGTKLYCKRDREDKEEEQKEEGITDAQKTALNQEIADLDQQITQLDKQILQAEKKKEGAMALFNQLREELRQTEASSKLFLK